MREEQKSSIRRERRHTTADPSKGSTGGATASVGNDDSRLRKSLRKEVVLEIAVGFVCTRTVVAAWASRARRSAVEAVRERCAQVRTEARGGRHDF